MEPALKPLSRCQAARVTGCARPISLSPHPNVPQPGRGKIIAGGLCKSRYIFVYFSFLFSESSPPPQQLD